MLSIAVDAGTLAHREIRAGSLTVSRVDFPAGQQLAWHAHPRACVAVVLEGKVRKRFSRETAEAEAGTLISMPPDERHEDRFGQFGSSIVVVESENGVNAVSCFREWEALLIGLRISRELMLADEFSALAVEGLALELCAVAARGSLPAPGEKWLHDARLILGERCREAPTAAEIADAVGVHPARLARAFRAHYCESLGECARRLRLEWAAEQLMRSDVGLVLLSVDAGFVDQSHFTRAFRNRFGITPARYRAAFR